MRQPPLPPATVVLRCDACGADVETLDINTQHLASELSRLRRAHAVRRHAWSALAAGALAASGRQAP
jgi:hypothetical protein